MNNYDRRLQRLEEKRVDPSKNHHFVILMEGESVEAGMLRIGVNPNEPCLVIGFVSANDERPSESD